MRPPNKHQTVRVGGLFNQPNYLASYYEASRLLMEVGKTDQLAMPILYLQRHTVELLLKELLNGAQRAIEATQEIQAASGQPVLCFTAKTFKHHDLGELLADAESALSALGWKIPVPGLRDLVSLCQWVEQGDETRWRYAKGKNGQPSFPDGLGERLVELPIHDIQERLSQIVKEELLGKPYEEVIKADTISSYIWSLILTNHQLDQDLYSLGLL